MEMLHCFLYKSMLPTLTQLIILKVNIFNVQYMWEAGSRWAIYPFTRNNEESPLLYFKLCILHGYMVRMHTDQQIRLAIIIFSFFDGKDQLWG